MSDATLRMLGRMNRVPPMVGRSAERVLLTEQLAAVKSGHGEVVIIGGEAGIGKSTIARNLITQAESDGFLAIVGQNYDLMAAPPYGVWLDLAESYRHAATSVDMPPLPDGLASHNLGSITSQSAFFADVTAFVQALAAITPVIVLLEDVHWADPASLELLRHISTRLARVPLLLVVTYRVDEITRQNPFHHQLPLLVHDSGGLRLDLKRLDATDLDALVALMYGVPENDRSRLIGYLLDHAEGNPFFVIELLRALEEQLDGGLIRTGGTWSLGGLDRALVPPLVRQVIDMRLARLGDATRRPLSIAAVIGHEMSVELLASVADIPESDIYNIIDTAFEWHVFTATPNGTGIQFVHALTREVIYDSIAPHRRAAFHRAVAEAIEALPQGDIDAIAYHFERAGDPRAPACLTRAGDRAQRAYAWLTARDRFAVAAELLENVPGEEGSRARLLYRCGRLQRYSHTQEGIENLHTAARLARLADDKVLSADAIHSRGVLKCFADQWRTGLEDMLDGVDFLESLPLEDTRITWATLNWMADALPAIDLAASSDLDPASEKLMHARISHRRGSLPWFLASVGRLEEARTIAAAFRNHTAGIGIGPLVLSNCGHMEFGVGIAAASLGHPDAARQAFAAAQDIYLQIDHHACIAFVHLAELLDLLIPWDTTNVSGRRRSADAAEDALGKARGAFAQGMSVHVAQLMVLFLDGHWSEAREIDLQNQSYGTYNLRRHITHVLGPIARFQGRHEEAWKHVLSLLPQGPDTEPGGTVLLDALMLQGLAANLALDAGDTALAQRWLEACDTWLAWSGSVLGRATNELSWARLHRLEGDEGRAQDRIERAIVDGSNPDQPLVLIQARRMLGTLALETGDAETARRELAASLALADACEIAFERALTLIELARLRWPPSIDLLAEARSICDRLGARPTLDRIDALARNTTDRVDVLDISAGLTIRELEVLRLVAGGLTDAEVGDRLSISPRTVGQHLRSVYNKLGVRSRTQATRSAMQRGLV